MIKNYHEFWTSFNKTSLNKLIKILEMKLIQNILGKK